MTLKILCQEFCVTNEIKTQKKHKRIKKKIRGQIKIHEVCYFVYFKSMKIDLFR